MLASEQHTNDVDKMLAAFEHGHAVVRCLAHTLTKTEGWNQALLGVLSRALQSDRSAVPTLYLQGVAWPPFAATTTGRPYDRMAAEPLLVGVCRIVYFTL